MKQFLLNEQQAQQLFVVLGELPAKQSLSSIDMLRNLPLSPQQPLAPAALQHVNAVSKPPLPHANHTAPVSNPVAAPEVPAAK
jgi:hypothetical protein